VFGLNGTGLLQSAAEALRVGAACIRGADGVERGLRAGGCVSQADLADDQGDQSESDHDHQCDQGGDPGQAGGGVGPGGNQGVVRRGEHGRDGVGER